jgi:hypothetical protein
MPDSLLDNIHDPCKHCGSIACSCEKLAKIFSTEWERRVYHQLFPSRKELSEPDMEKSTQDVRYDCIVDPILTRVCSRGTRSCKIDH